MNKATDNSPNGGLAKVGTVCDAENNKMNQAGMTGWRSSLMTTLALAMLIFTASASAQSHIVADPHAPGRQRPTVLKSANGTPLVNIQTPSQAGVSRNTYKRFDVDHKGAILNNARKRAKTQLGGWVQGNPWLATGSAKVILNEVNSHQPSRLRGYLEVAGQEAEMVVANPAGITCDGCGFINANRATLTTGTPQMKNGALTGYRVDNGMIRVSGSGLDASQTDYTRLIARSVQVNAGVWANTLDVVAGTNTVSADGKDISKHKLRGQKPDYAIDVGQLGGMYAHEIYLVGTEDGVGVRNAGTIGATAGHLVVTADGHLENTGALQSRRNVAIKASRGVDNQGTISAGQSLSIHTPGNIHNDQGTLSARRLEVKAAGLTNNEGTIKQTGPQKLALRAGRVSNRKGGRIGASVTKKSAGQAGKPADNQEKHTATNKTAQNTTGNKSGKKAGKPVDQKTNHDNQKTAKQQPDGWLHITHALNNDNGTLTAGGGINLQAATGLDNSHGQLQLNQFALESGDLTNTNGRLFITGDSHMHADTLRNDNGQLQVAGDWTLDAHNLFNRNGSLLHGGTDNTTFNIADTLDDTQGLMASNAAQWTLNAQTIINKSGQIKHAGDHALNINAETLQGQEGNIDTAGNFTLTIAQSADQQGGTITARRARIFANDLNNQSGRIIASGDRANVFQIKRALNNHQGIIATNGDLALETSALNNEQGTIKQAGDGALTLQVTHLQGTGGTLLSNGVLTLTGTTIQLAKGRTSARTIAIDTGDLTTAGGQLTATSANPLDLQVRNTLDNTAGTLQTNGALQLTAGTLDNQKGRLLAAGPKDSTLNVARGINNQSGQISAAGRTRIKTQRLNNSSGEVYSGGPLDLTADKTLDNTGGTIAADGDLQLATGKLINRDNAVLAAPGGDATISVGGLVNNDSGDIQAAQTLTLHSVGLNNQNGQIIAGTVRIQTAGQPLDNTAGTLAATKHDLVIQSGALDNTNGLLQAAGDVQIHSPVLSNAQGRVSAGQQLTIAARQIDNHNTRGDKPRGLQGDTIVLNTHQINNQNGLIAANRHITLTGTVSNSQLDNTSGLVSSAGDLTITAGQLHNTNGTLLSAGNQTLKLTRFSGDGRLLSRGNLNLLLASDWTQTGTITADGQATLTTSGQLTNHGTIQADGLHLQAHAIDNRANGQISGGQTDITVDTTLTNRGLIDGGETHIQANRFDNLGTGRIYGDHLAISTHTLNNRDETNNGQTKAGTIAARERLDIGTYVLNNSEHALIFSAGSGANALNIGGALDKNNHATGQARTVHNASATIESLGGLTLATDKLRNTNEHFKTREVQISGPKYYVLIEPDCNADWCHKKYDPTDPALNMYIDDRDRDKGQYFMTINGHEVSYSAWTTFRFDRTEYETQVTASDPAKIVSGGDMTLLGDDLENSDSHIIAGGALTADGIDNHQTPGEHRIHDEGTAKHREIVDCGPFNSSTCVDTDTHAYEPADIITSVDLGTAQIKNHTQPGSSPTIALRRTGQVSQKAGGSSGLPSIQKTRPSGVAPGEAHRITVVKARGDTPDEIRTARINTAIPQASLFQQAPATKGYLIETDPAFANYRQWLSSDYMLNQLMHDPNHVQKRLGDGFYEQRLIREQVEELTGHRYLKGYGNDLDEYKALMDAGVAYAKQYNLTPGVALTAGQMANLTHDMVWLVSQSVTLPDGSTTKALVPKLYVRSSQGEITGQGGLISARSIHMNAVADLINSGTIAGRTDVAIVANNLRNLQGRIQGQNVVLSAAHDLDNIGGILQASQNLVAAAGHDIHIQTTTASGASQAGLSSFNHTNIDRMGQVSVTGDNGQLTLAAGHDINLTAAAINNSGQDGQTLIQAGHDVALDTVTTHVQENLVADAHNYLKQGHSREHGTTIDTQGNLALRGGHNVTLTAADLRSDRGAVVAVAGHDLTLNNGRNSDHWRSAHKHTSHGLLSSTTTTTRDSSHDDWAGASTISGQTVALYSGHNTHITASNLVADDTVQVIAGNDLTVDAGENYHRENHYAKTVTSGLFSGGGIGITIGTRKLSTDARGDGVTHTGSTVGSVHGNVTLAAGNHYQQTASNVVAGGDIGVAAKAIDVKAALNTGHTRQTTRFSQSGLSLSLSSPVISAVQTARSMGREAHQSKDKRMQALATMTSALAAKNAYESVQADPSTGGGIKVSLTIGNSKHSSTRTTATTTAVGSVIHAGNDVAMMARGGGDASDITVQGSDITAGDDMLLHAEHDIDLLAAKNTSATDRQSHGSSNAFGIALTYGSNGASFGITASASRSKGEGKGRGATWRNTHLAAGDGLVLQSGHDTTLRGATARADRIRADVGHDLTIESLQDVNTYHSEDQSAGGSVTVGYGFAGSAHYSHTEVDGDYAAVREQSGLQAGDGGFQVDVGNHVGLIGGVIASSDKAVTNHANHLQAATLSASDVANHDDYRAESVSLAGGISRSDEAPEPAGDDVSSKTNHASDATTHGSDWAWQNYGTDANALGSGIGQDEGEAGSTTRSGISDGSLVLTGEADKSALETLDRTVRTGEQTPALQQHWNPLELARKVKAEAQITAAMGQQAHQTLDNYIQPRRAELQQQLKRAAGSKDKARIQQQLADLKHTERAMNVLIGAVSGSGTSAITKATLAEAADWMRKQTIENSQLFAGVTDGETVITNLSGDSAGINGDHKKAAGGRINLDVLCGTSNERCATNPDGSLKRDDQGLVKFAKKKVNMGLKEFLKTPKGQKAIAPFGGLQGTDGTLFGYKYEPDGFIDHIMESYAGVHDYIGGQLSGLYDDQGNQRRGLSELGKKAYTAWSAVALLPATPFAAAQGTSPEVWNAISVLLETMQ